MNQSKINKTTKQKNKTSEFKNYDKDKSNDNHTKRKNLTKIQKKYFSDVKRIKNRKVNKDH